MERYLDFIILAIGACSLLVMGVLIKTAYVIDLSSLNVI